jgi:hypothetical protein
MHLRLHRDDDDLSGKSDCCLSLRDGCNYVVYPSYVKDHLDVDRLVSNLRNSLAGCFRYWKGRAGGGVLELNQGGSWYKRWDPATYNINNKLCNVERINGLHSGNGSGEDLASSVVYGIPDFPPPSAVKLGYPKPPRTPKVAVTAEHFDGLLSDRLCLAVPKRTSKLCKYVESTFDWFGDFGVAAEACPVPDNLLKKISHWYDPPSRDLLCFRLNGGVKNSAWQLAVTAYVANHWWTNWHGLEAMHFLAEIEGKPEFRSHWTNTIYR